MRSMLVVIDERNLTWQGIKVGRKTDYLALLEFLALEALPIEKVRPVVFVSVPLRRDRRKRFLRWTDSLRHHGIRVIARDETRTSEGWIDGDVDAMIISHVPRFVRRLRPEVVVLVSGDGHFADLCYELRAEGISVWVASISLHLSHALRESASRTVYLEPYFSKCELFPPRAA